MDKVTDIFDVENIPCWATDAEIITRDPGISFDGEFGYECHALMKGNQVVGYVYDNGAGYEWCEGEEPEPAVINTDGSSW